MGLASALSTALTGLNAAETTIDVVGNNVANSNTVGFKASQATFATQFLQTQSLGSAPTDTRGGNNPRQIGLGTQVAEISPKFTQGTIQVSNSATDLAIQGDGFFIVGGNSNEQLYTRSGIFKTNADNELVTTTGQRLLGYGVNNQFQVQQTTLQPLTIPLGQAAVAQATKNVVLGGTLSPTGNLADTAEIIGSRVLIDGTKEFPATAATLTGIPPINYTGATAAVAVGLVPAGTHSYRMVEYNSATGQEGPPSNIFTVTTVANQHVTIPTPATNSASFDQFRLYRSDDAVNYGLVGSATAPAGTITDNSAAVGAAGPQPTLSQGSYSYYITYRNSATGNESRPSPLTGPLAITSDGRDIHLTNIPQPTSTDYNQVVLYRNLTTNSSSFFQLTGPLTLGQTQFVDNASDASIASNHQINLDGPPASPGTALTSVVVRDGTTYTNPFSSAGSISLSASKGGRTLAAKTLNVTTGTGGTTLQDLADFVSSATGIRNDIPVNPDDPTGAKIAAGASLNASTGVLNVTSNRGTGNAVDIGLTAMTFTPTNSNVPQAVNLGFSQTQTAKGESAVTDFIAYDSLGIPVNVRVTSVLELRDSSRTIYRWTADSGNNQNGGTGAGAQGISVGTGEIVFDGLGRQSNTATAQTVSVNRQDVSSQKPLSFTLDFSQVSGLASTSSAVSATRQDGSAAGSLSSFTIGEDGLIRGVFSNGISRDLGQIRLARFNNNTGLEQRGSNLFATGIDSGLPIQGNPGQQGIGTIVAGAQELSNTDVGQNLIDLITASTQYRGGARVITSVQQLLDELLNLRR